MDHATARERLHKALEEEASYAPHLLVVDLGRDFAPRKPPDDTPAGEFMNCFYSSFQLASQGGLLYCEGWATSTNFQNSLGRPHAWCLDDEGQVVDVTYAGRDTYDVVAYRGVVIPLEVAEPHTARGSRGVLVAYQDDAKRLRNAIEDANKRF